MTLYFFQLLQSIFCSSSSWLTAPRILLTTSPSKCCHFSSIPQTPGLRTWRLNIRKITFSSTKFYWCISTLPSDVSAQLTHLTRDPGDDPYQDIKDRLIHLYSISNYQKIPGGLQCLHSSSCCIFKFWYPPCYC